MSVPVTITITGHIADNSRVEHLRTELALHEMMSIALEGVGKAGVKDAAHVLHIGAVEPPKRARKPRAPKAAPAPEAPPAAPHHEHGHR